MNENTIFHDEHFTEFVQYSENDATMIKSVMIRSDELERGLVLYCTNMLFIVENCV